MSGSKEAEGLAAAILEVLAGVAGTLDAAEFDRGGRGPNGGGYPFAPTSYPAVPER